MTEKTSNDAQRIGARAAQTEHEERFGTQPGRPLGRPPLKLRMEELEERLAPTTTPTPKLM